MEELQIEKKLAEHKVLAPTDAVVTCIAGGNHSNMVMYAVFSAVIMNYVGVLSCAVIAVTTAVSLIRAKKRTDQ